MGQNKDKKNMLIIKILLSAFVLFVSINFFLLTRSYHRIDQDKLYNGFLDFASLFIGISLSICAITIFWMEL